MQPRVTAGTQQGRALRARLRETAVPRWIVVVPTAVAALGLVTLTHAGSAGGTVRVLGDTRVGWACALLGLAVAGPLLHSGLLRAGQATVGASFGRWEAVRLAAGIHAANLSVRAAGAAGLGVLLGHCGSSVAPIARSAAYVLGRQVAHVAFATLVLGALVLVSVDGHLTAIIAGGGAIFFLSRAARIALLWFAATHPEALPRWRRLDRLRAHTPEFAALLRRAAADRRKLLRIASWALALDALRVGWLWVALHAVGASPSVDVAVESYGTVALLGTVSILPAGLGTVDAGLAATLHHTGMATATAVAGVLLFRVADLWVPLVAGARPALAVTRSAGARRARRRHARVPAGVAQRLHPRPRA